MKVEQKLLIEFKKDMITPEGYLIKPGEKLKKVYRNDRISYILTNENDKAFCSMSREGLKDKFGFLWNVKGEVWEAVKPEIEELYPTHMQVKF